MYGAMKNEHTVGHSILKAMPLKKKVVSMLPKSLQFLSGI